MPMRTYDPTAEEQLLLEYVNRMRLDPVGELDAWGSLPGNVENAISWFGVSMQSFAAQMDALSPVAPLAWNKALARAAQTHNQMMIDHDQQSHRVTRADGSFAEPGLGDRARAAGYDFSGGGVAENVFAYAEDPFYAHSGFVIDWGYDKEDMLASGELHPDWKRRGDGIQDPAGHRDSLMNGNLTEIGIAYVEENDRSTTVGPFLVTQNLGSRSDYLPQLLGVVFEDLDGDGFYGIGEGQGGISVTASGRAGVFTTTTWGAGGYQMVLPAGSYEVSFSGQGLATVTRPVTIGTQNVKLDLLAGEAVSVPNPEPEPGRVLVGAPGGDRLQGGNGDDWLYGDGILPGYDMETSGLIHRLYGAALNREPDVAGYLQWSDWLRSGRMDIRDMATEFVGGLEFRATYQGLDDAGFVTLLYRNVLGRAPDAEGMAGWMSALSSGRMERTDLVLNFANSQEYIGAMADEVAAFAAERSMGHWADDVFRLYQSVLGRAPDQAGLTAWVGLLAGGMRLEEVVAGFTASPEFKATYGLPDDGGFIDLLYRNVLGREADAAGRAGWLSLLEEGAVDRDGVVIGFSNSPEFVASSRPALVDWTRAQGPDDVLDAGLSSAEGANILYGGAMADEFQFRAVSPASGGQSRNEIMDLEAWDWLRFEGFGYTSARDVLEHISDRAEGAVFSDQGVEVLFRGLSADDLGTDMFLF